GLTDSEINNSTIRSILDKEKLIGPTFMDWYRNLRIVLKAEKKLVHLEQPLPPTYLPVEPQGVRDAYTALYDAQLEVTCLMLANVSPELQKNEEGQFVSSYILKIKGYLDNLERLGYLMPQELETIPELHVMLELHEKGIPKKFVTPVVLAIRRGKIKKKKNKPQGAKEKGNRRNRECDKCWGEKDGRNRVGGGVTRREEMSYYDEVVKLPKKLVAACMTCPICNKLYRDATTLAECLHTFGWARKWVDNPGKSSLFGYDVPFPDHPWMFIQRVCRKCISKKFTDDELECCPICNADLGCVPEEKLRSDNNLQDMRGKIFPSKRQRVKAPEVTPSVTLPLRRKERSLSSLVVDTPRVSPQTTLTGKRSKIPPRKKPRFSADKSVKKDDDSADVQQDSSSSRETSNRFNHKLRQVEPVGNPWNCLVEVANRSKSSNVKSEPQRIPKGEVNARQLKGKDLKRSKFQDENGRSDVDATESPKPRKKRKYRKKKAASQGVLDAHANNAAREKRINPIWFHLVPSEEQEGEPLGQIQGSFIRLKDVNVPVAVIQKFVMSKLQLGSDHEIELKCMGRPLVPTLLLGTLMEMWLQTQPTSQAVSVVIGSSAKEYMMEISYARKPSGVGLGASQALAA
ncbi:E3 ubiquitin protein ligase DRIP2, partial [Tanacetum coccineum]